MSIYSCSQKRTLRRQSYKEERLRRRHRRQQKLNCYAKTNEDQEYEYVSIPVYAPLEHGNTPVGYKVVRRKKEEEPKRELVYVR